MSIWRIHTILWAAGFLAAPISVRAGTPVDTTFTYQGQLKSGGAPVTGVCDVKFDLWDDPHNDTPPHQVGPTLTFDGMGTHPPPIFVVGGLFDVPLDFGDGVFPGDARWLRISVRCPHDETDSAPYTVLEPRQAMTPVPYALALPGLRILHNDVSPNVIGGFSENSVADDVVGATIGGGGEAGLANKVNGPFGTVSGGTRNEADEFGTVGGGEDNRIAPTGGWATIAGGSGNFAGEDHAFIGGGQANRAEGPGATIAGGSNNMAIGFATTISGGSNNRIGNRGATVGGGESNFIGEFADQGTIAGGESNIVKGYRGAIGGGFHNTISENGEHATIAGGSENVANAPTVFVGGGEGNIAYGRHAVVAGGLYNVASGKMSTIGGGYGNYSIGDFATVGGGGNNAAYGTHSTIGGGEDNATHSANGQIRGQWATVPGGRENRAYGDNSFAAGSRAEARHEGSFVWSDGTGGVASSAPDQFIIYATGGVGIGTNQTPSALNLRGSFDNPGWITFASNGFGEVLWDIDSQSGGFNIGESQAGPGGEGRLFLEPGGKVGINNTNPAHPLEIGADPTNGNGAHCTAGGMWTNGSDRNSKQNFTDVDAREVLARVADLPISRWQYCGEPDEVRHIGPTAQDFHSAFGLGESERHIGTIDADGVALAAIQGLHALLRDKEVELRRQEERIADLAARLQRMESKTARGSNFRDNE